MARREDRGRDPWGRDNGGLPPEFDKILKSITKSFRGGRFNILFIIAALVLIWIVFHVLIQWE